MKKLETNLKIKKPNLIRGQGWNPDGMRFKTDLFLRPMNPFLKTLAWAASAGVMLTSFEFFLAPLSMGIDISTNNLSPRA